MKTVPNSIIGELNERSRTIFSEIVSSYLENGEPLGSRTLSRRLVEPLSPATIRNVMADLEDMGLLYAPHTSAGRLPTDLGLRLFVDGPGWGARTSGTAGERLAADVPSRAAGRGGPRRRALDRAGNGAGDRSRVPYRTLGGREGSGAACDRSVAALCLRRDASRPRRASRRRVGLSRRRAGWRARANRRCPGPRPCRWRS